MTATDAVRGGDLVRVLSPHDAKLRREGAGKLYRLECDGPALFAFRDEEGTIRYRYLRAEVERMRAAGRLVVATVPQGGA